MNPFELMIDLVTRNEQDIDEHILTLFSLTLSLKPTTIYELGVRTARSTFPFLYASHIVKSNVISVDINDIRPDIMFPEDWKKRWQFYKKDALEFLEKDFPIFRNLRNSIQQESGDIIYIDDWHAGDHVEKELALISDLVTPKDLIILHDLMYGNSQPHYRSVENPKDKQWDKGGPYKPVSKLDLNKWEYMTIPRCHGLTLVRKKSDKIITE
jgi:hypothetical protein